METSRLDRVRSRVRRAQLVLGAGFFSAVMGAIISASLVMKLQSHLPPMHSATAAMLLNAVVSRVWVYAVLPVTCYGLARVAPVSRWGLPVGAALTGEAFYLAIDLVTGGQFFVSPLAALLRAATLAAGVLLSARAIVAAQRSVTREQEKAQAAAQARADEYAAMLRESEKLAEKNEQRANTGN